MPPNSQTEAGPSRIEGVFRIVVEDSIEGGQDVQISQPDLLRRQSLVLRKLIDDKGTNQEMPLKIEKNLGIDCGAMKWVLEYLQGQQSARATNPKTLAIHCAILWKYECIPDSFEELGNNMQPRSSSSSLFDGDQQSSTSASPSRVSRCWEGRKDLEICRQLITIAIVLGWQEILEDEIKTAVWGTYQEMDITILPGVDMEAIRRDELEKLFDYVRRQIDDIDDDHDKNLAKTAKSIRETLKQHNLGNFSKSWKHNAKDLRAWKPYDFLSGVANALAQPELQTQDPEPRARVEARGFRHMPLGVLFHRERNTNGTEISGEQEKKDAIVVGLEVLVHKRRRKLAAKLMQKRDSTVQDWRNKLDRQDR